MDDLNDVLVFTRVAEAESFTRAAARLGLPKSSVSTRVSRLEDRLGARLIERTTRRLRLTDLGQRYFEHAKRVILELEQASAAVKSFQAAPSGSLRIAAPTILGQAFLPPIIAAYAKQFPDVHLFVELSNRRVDLLEEGFDVAIRAGALPDSSLVARRMGRGTARLYASLAYVAVKGMPDQPHDLARHRLLENGGSAKAHSWTLRAEAGDEVRIDISFAMICNDPEVLLAAARDGLGIANLPNFIGAPDVVRGNLVAVLPEWSVRRVEINAVYPSHKSLSPALRAFLDLAANQLRRRLD
ncbi:DNA-binding transcriptional LysR family regulator [Polymorphobacter multimanifer]|uniref:DNA-binding transcriptional LysR family regulator n=1 Tax=Polymorphobacter multimanifer TaxID=1070431 RepID=A0A841LEF5_9SPHN|nr:LysR family transcriptional regulator [Polymorphobacter multimanifer]MBB6229423.1 DNA-binding transcriptional LysR family regulator [Polymorphobacter multimanifer]